MRNSRCWVSCNRSMILIASSIFIDAVYWQIETDKREIAVMFCVLSRVCISYHTPLVETDALAKLPTYLYPSFHVFIDYIVIVYEQCICM